MSTKKPSRKDMLPYLHTQPKLSKAGVAGCSPVSAATPAVEASQRQKEGGACVAATNCHSNAPCLGWRATLRLMPGQVSCLRCARLSRTP